LLLVPSSLVGSSPKSIFVSPPPHVVSETAQILFLIPAIYFCNIFGMNYTPLLLLFQTQLPVFCIIPPARSTVNLLLVRALRVHPKIPQLYLASGFSLLEKPEPAPGKE
jgi:hypothetical protein